MQTILRHAAAPTLFALAMAWSPASAWAGPADEARAQLRNAEQRAADAEARIRDIVRDIANSGSQQTTIELNKQLKHYEKVRADAQFDIVQARLRLDNLVRQDKQLQADISAFRGAIDAFVRERSTLDGQIQDHNRDAAEQRAAVTRFNSLPANQRTQAEADRLNRWRDLVDSRARTLNGRRAELENRRQELLRWEGDIKRRAADVGR
jgi:chromosome segregation ATPase